MYQIIFKAKDPYNPASWTNAVHFNFTGYDTEPFWDTDGKVYINGAHAWRVAYGNPLYVKLLSYLLLLRPGIHQAEIDLDTGKVGEWRTIWNGTGGMVRYSTNPFSDASKVLTTLGS